MFILVRLCLCPDSLALHLREALEQRLGAVGDADMMEMLAAVAKLRVSPCISWGCEMLQTCHSTSQWSMKLLLSIATALREEVRLHALLHLIPP